MKMGGSIFRGNPMITDSDKSALKTTLKAQRNCFWGTEVDGLGSLWHLRISSATS